VLASSFFYEFTLLDFSMKMEKNVTTTTHCGARLGDLAFFRSSLRAAISGERTFNLNKIEFMNGAGSLSFIFFLITIISFMAQSKSIGFHFTIVAITAATLTGSSLSMHGAAVVLLCVGRLKSRQEAELR